MNNSEKCIYQEGDYSIIILIAISVNKKNNPFLCPSREILRNRQASVKEL